MGKMDKRHLFHLGLLPTLELKSSERSRPFAENIKFINDRNRKLAGRLAFFPSIRTWAGFVKLVLYDIKHGNTPSFCERFSQYFFLSLLCSWNKKGKTSNYHKAVSYLHICMFHIESMQPILFLFLLSIVMFRV